MYTLPDIWGRVFVYECKKKLDLLEIQQPIA